ncbi:MAG: hypothetical protein ACRDTA_08445 [Pseudonocardiaceae bacterium]
MAVPSQPRETRRLAEEFNATINKFRYVIERAIAYFKTWRCMHTNYRRHERTYATAFNAVRALHFFKLRLPMPSWRCRWRAAGYKQYALPIASAAAGALLGAGVQNLANSNLRLMSTIAVVLCLGLVAVYARLTARDREITMANQVLREKAAQDTSSIISKIRQLEKQVGVEIRYQLVAEIDHTASWKEEILGQQVEIAKTEILILDLLSTTGRRPDTHQDYRLESYYSNLMKKATNGVLYHRVLQVEDPTMPTPCLPDTPFRKHCQEV